jgi:hypothetical protein
VRTRTLPGLILLAGTLFGCIPAEGDARIESPSAEPNAANCAGSFEPGFDPVSDLARLTAACAAGLQAVTPVKVGDEQGESADAERFSFRGRDGR